MNTTEPSGLVTAIETAAGQIEIPDFEIDSLARCLLPKIQAYFKSQEGREAFEAWQQHRQ